MSFLGAPKSHRPPKKCAPSNNETTPPFVSSHSGSSFCFGGFPGDGTRETRDRTWATIRRRTAPRGRWGWTCSTGRRRASHTLKTNEGERGRELEALFACFVLSLWGGGGSFCFYRFFGCCLDSSSCVLLGFGCGAEFWVVESGPPRIALFLFCSAKPPARGVPEPT